MLDAHIITKTLPSGDILLRDVTFVAAPGDIVVLLGASGVGKTTTLRILLGLDRDFEGQVTCHAKRVGALFQEPRLLPWRTVAENIRLVAPPDRDIAGLLGDVGLPGTEAMYPRQLSLGMARRVALARALAIQPDLLVLDEPFASLDAGTAARIARRLGQAQPAALIIAMHDEERAMSLATRIVVLAGHPATVAYQRELVRASTPV